MIRLPQKLSTKYSALVNKSVELWNKCAPFRRCMFCDVPVHRATSACQDCNNDLDWNRSACSQCAEPFTGIPQEMNLKCPDCLKQPPTFTYTAAPLLYGFPVDQCIHQLKYRGKRYRARQLARLVAEHIEAAYRSDPLPQCLIPVPAHRKTHRQRGFNQAELIARNLAKAMNLPYRNEILEKVRVTQSQAQQSKTQRRRNLKDSFVCHLTSTDCLSHVAIVDDVMTTGATLNVLSELIKNAGVARVDAWCLARTPKYQATSFK